MPGKLLEPAPQLPPTPQRIANAAGADYFAFGHAANTGFAQASDDAIFCASSVNEIPIIGAGKTAVFTIVPLSTAVNNPDVIFCHANNVFTRGCAVAIGGAGFVGRIALWMAGMNAGQWLDLTGTSVASHIGQAYCVAVSVDNTGTKVSWCHTGGAVQAHLVSGVPIPPVAGDIIAFGRASFQGNWLASAQLSQAVFADWEPSDAELQGVVDASSALVIPALSGEVFRLDAGLWAFGASSQKIGCAGNVMLRNGGYAGVNVQLAP